MSAYLTYPDPNAAEWEVTISCDGIRIDYRIRRRRGLEHSEAGVRPIESFQFWKGEILVSDVVLPFERAERLHEEAILRILHKVLGCSQATVEGEKDPILAVFGTRIRSR